MMKKILNDPASYVDETLEGLILAHPEIYALLPDEPRVVVRATPGRNKVGIVTGGGSGHLPLFVGYVGDGLLDAGAAGDVFASPSAEQIASAIRAADSGAGVLCLYGNYGGDILNFDMAIEMVEDEGIATTTVLVADDVASAPLEDDAKRRGVAGMVFAFKAAGAAANAGLDLDDVTRVAQKAADNARSFGVALGPCIVPQVGKPTFQLGDLEMELGMGIHGERGVRRGALEPADQIADVMLRYLLDDLAPARGSRVAVLVNSLGATPLEELYILFRYCARRLASEGVEIAVSLVGRYATSMEMTGASITLMALDEELERYLRAPARCAFWTV